MTRIGIPYEEALATVVAAVKPLGPELIALAEAEGRVLVAPIAVENQTLPAGQPLQPDDLVLLAAHGIDKLEVVRRPRVAIVASGNGLVARATALAAGMCYESDSALLAAIVRREGGLPLPLALAQATIISLRMCLTGALAHGAELILTAAGSHQGKNDIVRTLMHLDGRMHFWQVALAPERPLLFGALAGVQVISMPADPAEALVCSELFVRPTLLRLAGHTELARPKVSATLEAPVARHPNRHYVRGLICRSSSGLIVHPLSREHGLEAALSEANALIMLPPGEGVIPAGSVVEALLLDQI